MCGTNMKRLKLRIGKSGTKERRWKMREIITCGSQITYELAVITIYWHPGVYPHRPSPWLPTSMHVMTIVWRSVSVSLVRMVLTLSAKAFSISAPSVWSTQSYSSYNCRSAELLSTFKRGLQTELVDIDYILNVNTIIIIIFVYWKLSERN